MNKTSKFSIQTGSGLLSSPVASGSRMAYCGIEQYNIPIPQDAPCSGAPSDFLLPATAPAGQPHVLSTLQRAHFLTRLFPLSNLPTAASMT